MCSSDLAGTVLEEGECQISVTNSFGSGRYDRIVSMIEESEKLKSTTEDKASHLADTQNPLLITHRIMFKEVIDVFGF